MDSIIETLFLVCLAFGVIFTLLSALLGGSDDSGHDLSHADGSHGLHAHSDGSGGSHIGHSNAARFDGLAQHVNVYSVNGFLTWFGAAGYGLTHFVGWPVAAACSLALLAGLGGAFMVALFLARLRSGERVMNPADYRIEGTLAHVSVSIGSGGVGEIVFEKQGARRSEAARSLNGQPIPHGTEVLVVVYDNGVAMVRPFAEVMDERFPPGGADSSAPLNQSSGG